MDDLQREEEEVYTPLRAQMNVDAECALVAQLEEQGHHMATNEVVGNFVNELDIEAEYEQVYTWKN